MCCIVFTEGKTPCDVHNCLNRGTCIINSIRQAHCLCPADYFGNQCQYYSKSELCDTKPCMNGARCGQQSDRATVSCLCVPGYHGPYCGEEYNECESNPCYHGNCTDRVNSYQCHCSKGWRGTNCNQKEEEAVTAGVNKATLSVILSPVAVVICISVCSVCFWAIKRSAWWKKRCGRRIGSTYLELSDNNSNTFSENIYTQSFHGIRPRNSRDGTREGWRTAHM